MRRRAATTAPGFLRWIELQRDDVPSFDVYPFAIPAVRGLDRLDLDPKITFLVGENGSGKSTLLEAIAIAAGFNPEGGSKNFKFATRSSESALHRYLRVIRAPTRERDGFFLRAESYFNVATQIDALDAEPGPGPPLIESYGGVSLHEQSHGESFLSLVEHRFRGHGLYLLDEPEAALSPRRQLTLLAHLHDLVERRASQLVIATHSPILLAYPGARLYHLDGDGLRPIAYEDTEHVQVTRDFLLAPERYFRHLFARDDDT